MKNIFLIIIVSAALTFTFGQQTSDKKVFSGNLSTDAKVILSNYSEPVQPQMVMMSGSKKSPMFAGLLSLLVPGAGEIYSEEYLKAGIFLVLEAAVLTTAVIYDNKGDRKTNEFQDYADAYKNPDHNWSAVRYAKWLIDFKNADPNIRTDDWEVDDTRLPPWERVNWKLLNAAETGHALPPHGEQQYYELIGKYHQYSAGWNDFSGNENNNQVSPNFLFYSAMRGDANDFYSVASTAVVGIYVNHFLSALDAVWSSLQYNKDLAVKFRLENIQLTNHAEFIPTVYVSYSF